MISFSHFLPRQELLPEKRMLFVPNLAKAAGSDFLYRRQAAAAALGLWPLAPSICSCMRRALLTPGWLPIWCGGAPVYI